MSSHIVAIHQAFERISSNEIHALQAFGIQQAGRNGLGRDGRFYVILGLIGLVLSILSPLAVFAKIGLVILSILLIIGGVKVHFRPELRDMLAIVALLGLSASLNVAAGLFSIMTSQQIILPMLFITLASVEGRWAFSLWQAQRVAKQSDYDFNQEYAHVVDLYHQLSEFLGVTEPHPQNPVLRLKAGKRSLRMMFSGRYGIILYRTGMIQVELSQSLAMRPANPQNPQALHFEAEMMVNKRVLRGEVSQISFQTFQAWQDSQS